MGCACRFASLPSPPTQFLTFVGFGAFLDFCLVRDLTLQQMLWRMIDWTLWLGLRCQSLWRLRRGDLKGALIALSLALWWGMLAWVLLWGAGEVLWLGGPAASLLSQFGGHFLLFSSSTRKAVRQHHWKGLARSQCVWGFASPTGCRAQ